jgi:FixJ family two-component response regulator
MTPTFDTLVQDFFCRRLIEQQGVSPRTVEAYRDTFRRRRSRPNVASAAWAR